MISYNFLLSWSNIYITPDLSRAEREAARKLREELAARRRAGEANLAIRKGRIVATDTNTTLRHRVPVTQGAGTANPSAGGAQASPEA